VYSLPTKYGRTPEKSKECGVDLKQIVFRSNPDSRNRPTVSISTGSVTQDVNTGPFRYRFVRPWKSDTGDSGRVPGTVVQDAAADSRPAAQCPAQTGGLFGSFSTTT